MKQRALGAPIRQRIQSLYSQKTENDSTDVVLSILSFLLLPIEKCIPIVFMYILKRLRYIEHTSLCVNEKLQEKMKFSFQRENVRAVLDKLPKASEGLFLVC